MNSLSPLKKCKQDKWCWGWEGQSDQHHQFFASVNSSSLLFVNIQLSSAIKSPEIDDNYGFINLELINIHFFHDKM